MRLTEMARLAEKLTGERTPFVQAIVVRAQHPTSVRPGDAAIVRADGSIEGFVGGVCAESSVRLQSLRVLETGEPLLLHLRPDEESEGAEDLARDGVVVAHNPCLSGGELEIFLEPCLPAPRLAVAGQTPIAQALGELAPRVGFDVVDVSGEGAEVDANDAAVVVAAHGRDEEAVLTAALRTGIPYVGLVASETRGAAVRHSLDLPEELRAQLHCPAGLPIGGRTPEEIALSILAQIVAERHRAPAGTPRQPAPAVAIDPVCGMEVAASEASLHLDVDGERRYFCSEHCRERFAAEHTHHA
jgi:xanthine dehydrogenase accessory factor